MDIFSAIFVVVPLILPVAAAFQIDPLHLGAIFLINLELGYLTPPVGMNLFLASYRFNKPMPQITRAVLPFMLVQLAAVLLVTFVPWLRRRFAPSPSTPSNSPSGNSGPIERLCVSASPDAVLGTSKEDVPVRSTIQLIVASVLIGVA